MARIEAFLKSKRSWKEKTVKEYAKVFHAFQNRYPGQDIDDLPDSDILDFLQFKADCKPRAARSFNTIMCLLDKYYSFAGRPGIFANEDWQKPQKKPLNITEQDIEYTKEACQNLRDRAIVSTDQHSGFRADEMASMAVRDVKFDANGVELTCNRSKTQERTIRCIGCAADLAAWLSAHPYAHLPDAPLFPKMAIEGGVRQPDDHVRGGHKVWSLQSLTSEEITKLFTRLRKRAKLMHPGMGHVHAHKLRAWDITQWHRAALDPLLNLKRHGQHDIKMIQVYVDADVTDANNKVLELSGKKPFIQPSPAMTQACPVCHVGNSPNIPNCANCGAPMNGILVPAPDVKADPKLVEEITKQVTTAIFHKMAARIAVAGDGGYVPRDLSEIIT